MSAFVEWSNPLNRCDFCNVFMTVAEGSYATRIGNVKFHPECYQTWTKMPHQEKTDMAVKNRRIRDKEQYPDG